MVNYKFTPNKWIIFDYLLGDAIGFTSIKNGEKIISFVADNGDMGEIPFASIERPRTLAIQPNSKVLLQSIAESIPNSYINHFKSEA